VDHPLTFPALMIPFTTRSPETGDDGRRYEGYIGFLAVTTASVTASLIEAGRRRFAAGSEADMEQRLNELNARLARIEAALSPARPGTSSDGIS
jgi:hypothetical protein